VTFENVAPIVAGLTAAALALMSLGVHSGVLAHELEAQGEKVSACRQLRSALRVLGWIASDDLNARKPSDLDFRAAPHGAHMMSVLGATLGFLAILIALSG